MRVALMLADAAHVAAGKLYVLGGGWSVMGSGPARMTIAGKIEVPWDQAGRRHEWEVVLVNADGQPVANQRGVPIAAHGAFEVSRPDQLPAGVPSDVPIAIDVGVVHVQPGRYEWRLNIDGFTEPDWFVAFTCRSGQ